MLNSELVLFQQYYKAKEASRQSEIDHVISENCSNICFDKIYLFSVQGAEPPIPESAKQRARIISLNDRATYSDWIKSSYSENIKGISLFANSDIMFDASVDSLYNINPFSEFAVISRHENHILVPNPHWTQDAWAFSPSQAVIRNKKHLIYSSQIPLGYPGCENRMAAIAAESGLRLVNPCNFVYAHHIHQGSSWSYDESQRILGTYRFVYPATITDASVDHDWLTQDQAKPSLMQSISVKMVFDESGLHPYNQQEPPDIKRDKYIDANLQNK